MATSVVGVRPVAGQRSDVRGWLDFFPKFVALAGPYWRSERGPQARRRALFLGVLTVLQVVQAVALNKWIEQLFNALERAAMDSFSLLILSLAALIAANVLIVTVHLRVKRRIQVDWRAWLTRRLVDSWMTAGRHYQVTLVPGEHDNPDGRIAEDIRIATEYAIDLVHSLFYSLILLVSFTNILWHLSGGPVLRIGAADYYVPGHLVWIAALYALTGTTVAVLLGRPLVRAAKYRQASEADFRFGLARARENAPSIALLAGEASERARFFGLFGGAVRAWDRQTIALANLFYFLASWSVISQIFPILVSAPRYITGAITLGTLMQAAQAFQQMAAALSWPIDNFAHAAEWRASVERVHGLHVAIGSVDRQAGRERGVIVERAPDGALRFEGLALVDPDGRPLLQTFSAAIARGERVLFAGAPAATANLIKAAVGLWPWGTGRIVLPAGARLFAMAQRPYLPVGPLRDAVSYPAPAEMFDEAAVRDALARVGLARLAASLDDDRNWAQELSLGDQQRLGFARLLLNRPDVIFVQEAIDTLDAESEREMIALLDREFPGSTIVAVCERPHARHFYRRLFAVLPDPNGAVVREIRDMPEGGLD